MKIKNFKLYLWDEVLSDKKISNTMIIMAGGKGSRLGKFTKIAPKHSACEW